MIVTSKNITDRLRVTTRISLLVGCICPRTSCFTAATVLS